MTTQVYRSGTVAPPAKRGVEAESYLDADSVKPEGRQGRTDAIFAAPNLRGVLRWLYANISLVKISDPYVREIRVNPDTVWVYSVEAWERASGNGNYGSYWETGMTLSEWNATVGLDPSEWELLLGASDVMSVKPVSDNRALAYMEEQDLFFEALPRALKDFRRK